MPGPTVLQLYADALTDAGVLQPAMTPSGPATSFIHRKFSDMVRAWSVKRERLFYIPEATYPLIANTSAYQIGPGAAQFDTSAGAYTRPLLIQTASVLIGTARRWPLNILTRPQWEVYQSKTLTDPDGPLGLFYDQDRPIGVIYVGPIPGNNTTLYLSQWNGLKTFTDGDETLIVSDYYPESYLLPLRAGLAIELCSAYKTPVTQQLLGVFQGGIQAIENRNLEAITGSFGFTQTLTGPNKGDGVMQAGAPPPPQAQ